MPASPPPAISPRAAPTCSCSRPAAASGGRVEQTQLRDGRLVQLGGEVVGPFHTAYRGLVSELGLTLVPSYVAEPGVSSALLDEGPYHGDDLPWLTEAERADHDRVEELFCDLARTVDPDDPWSHPDAGRLDSTSVDDWLRSVGATPAVRRTMVLLAPEPVHRSATALVAARGAAQAGLRRRDRVLRRRRVGERSGRGGERHGRAAHGGGAGRPRAARGAGGPRRRRPGRGGRHCRGR